MLLQWDYALDLGGPCRFVALLCVLAAVLVKRRFIIVVAQETRFTEIEESLDGMRAAAR